MKKSHKGLMRLNGDMSLDQECSWDEEKGGILEPVFVNGRLVREQSLADIRKILNG
jgi:nicotinamide phosphoribosyltransferase